MADYDALTYWRLTGRYNGIVGDTTGTWGDADNRPDLFNAEIALTLNLHVAGQRGVPELRLPGVTPPRTILLIPVDARIESGVLRLPGAPAGVDGVELVAKSAAMGLGDTPLLCTAEFGRTTIGGRQYQFEPVTFMVPTVEPAAYAAGRVQVITIQGAPTAGAWQLYYDSVGTTGLGTAPTAGAVQSALRALAPIGTNVDVAGADGGPFTATFTGPLGAGNPSPLVPVSTLTGGSAPKVVVTDAYTPVTLDLTTVERVDTPPSTPAELVVRMIPDDVQQDGDGFRFYSQGIPLGDTLIFPASGDGSATLPVLTIDTDDVPILDKETWVPATFTIDGTAMEGDIRGRGNSTWEQIKKPWNIRLDTASSLLGMTAATRWSLLANFLDKAGMRNAIALEVGSRMTGLDFTSKARHVEIVLNGAYQGLYQLVEPVRMEPGRVNLTAAAGAGESLTGAYLLEIDDYAPTEEDTVSFVTTHDDLPIKLDTPDGLSVTNGTAQLGYITDWVNDFETILYDDDDWLDPDLGYARLIDRDSFIDWYLVQELLAPNDGNFVTSCKLYKTRDNGATPGKLYMGPLWDFDLSMGKNVSYSDYSSSGWWIRGTVSPSGSTGWPGATWIVRMIDDPDFFAALNSRWEEMVELLDDLDDLVDGVARSVAHARIRDAIEWTTAPGQNRDSLWRTEASYIKDWLAARISWITTNLPTSGSPSVPAPVSHFDWHEGSGTSTTSIVSAHTLAGTSWDGTAAAGQFDGIIGDGNQPAWSIAFEFELDTLTALCALMVGPATTTWFEIDPTGHLKLYIGGASPAQLTASAGGVTTGVPHTAVFVVDGTGRKIYLDGTLVGSDSQTYTFPSSLQCNVLEASEPLDGRLESLRWWDVALTAEQVGAL